MTDRELMQMALDALESECDATKFGAAEDLRARLAGWEKLNMNDHKEGDLGIGTVKWDASAPLVVHPHPAFQTTEPQREWQGLTDGQKKMAYALYGTMTAEGFVKSLETKLKENNT